MTDKAILTGVKKYFSIHELVGKATYNKYGERAWMFLDIRLLHALLIIRINLGKRITINDWKWGGKLKQRGLRSNLQQIFSGYFKRKKLYLSGHVMGKAVDFDVEGMTAEEVRNWIIVNQYLFPFKIRLEHKFLKSGKIITWVHLDVFQEEDKPKIYLFNV